MLLSFSVPAMRPMVEAGLRQRAGEDIGNARVKRQTIRHLGPRAKAVLKRAEVDGWRCPYPLHLWWKSRTKERALMGLVEGARCLSIHIRHSEHFLGLVGVILDADPSLLIVAADSDPKGMTDFARADGFDSVDAFRDFFVPKPGDRFDGVLFKW